VTGLLFLAPALALGLAMLARRYPGERRIAAIAARRRSGVPALRRGVRAVAPKGFVALRPRGGALIALSLATRPPPAPALR
jgi:hypothetical protein